MGVREVQCDRTDIICLTDDEEDSPADRIVPTGRETMSGPRAPLTLALRFLGWNMVQPIDTLFGPAFDVSTPEGRSLLQDDTTPIDFNWLGLDCWSLSRIREIPIAGVYNPLCLIK